MFYENACRCLAMSRFCLRAVLVAESPVDYDQKRVRRGMLTMRRTIERVGLTAIYDQTAKDVIRIENELKVGVWLPHLYY